MKVKVIKSFPDFVEKKRRMINDIFDIADEARVDVLVSEGYVVKEEESECKNCTDESNQNTNAQSFISTSQDLNADNTSVTNNQDLDPQNSANQDTVLTSSENTSNSLSDEKPKVVRKAQIKKKDE